MSWQPIETAPMDGKYCDIWAKYTLRDKGQRWCNAYYDDGYYDDDGAWIVEDSSVGEGPLAEGWIVTHWMPLPEPPA